MTTTHISPSTAGAAMAIASGLEISNSTVFRCLPAACRPLHGVGSVCARLRQRASTVRRVNALSFKSCRLGLENINSFVSRHQSKENVNCSSSPRPKDRGCRIPRASFRNDDLLPEDAITDGPINEPEYYSYNDPNTGEPAPTYGIRTPLPDRQYWSDDMVDITRSTQAVPPYETSRKRKKAGGRRKKGESSLPPSEEELARAKQEEAENEALLQSLKEKFNSDDAEEEENGFRSDDPEDEDEEEDEEEDETSEFLSRTAGSSQDPSVALMKVENGEDVLTESATPLTNDELWWNWRKPPPEQKPWSAWQKRAGDTDTVMAAAMAETGQIELFGDKPTIAEATLARARKRVFYAERMEAEEARKREIGGMAYYKEWVKNYDEDVSKEAVQRRYEETGEDEGLQLLDMFAHQTSEEYRIMQGTDIRIRRDPLIMRMREEQIKQVWGGDPVYPTVNYERDPDEVADYRNPNMHEPIPDIVEMLRESGRLITQEEVKKLQELEKAQDLEFAEDDTLSGAVDIGDEEENDDDEDEDDEQDEEEEQAVAKPVDVKSSRGKRSEPKRDGFTLDDDKSKIEILDDDENEEEEE
ncbi:hypothetical protein R1flu_021577 [Riccia fluitans]|uniref:Uncharacterized protein n=1 Tax=Riccia fluitans TaxID=41844 RepID=A0ABD1ZSY7_9MARC